MVQGYPLTTRNLFFYSYKLNVIFFTNLLFRYDSRLNTLFVFLILRTSFVCRRIEHLFHNDILCWQIGTHFIVRFKLAVRPPVSSAKLRFWFYIVSVDKKKNYQNYNIKSPRMFYVLWIKLNIHIYQYTKTILLNFRIQSFLIIPSRRDLWKTLNFRTFELLRGSKCPEGQNEFRITESYEKIEICTMYILHIRNV